MATQPPQGPFEPPPVPQQPAQQPPQPGPPGASQFTGVEPKFPPATGGDSNSDKTLVIVTKALAGGYSGLSGLVILLFFLPWVSISCQGVTLISQSGFQVMVGEASENEDAEEELEEAFMGQMGTGGFGGPTFNFGPSKLLGATDPNLLGQFDSDPFGGGGGGFAGSSDGMGEFRDKADDIDGFFLVAFVPIGMLVTLGIGIVSLVAKPNKALPIIAIAGAAVAAFILLLCMVIDFPMEKKMEADLMSTSDDPMEAQMATAMAASFEVERLPAFIMSVAISFVAVGLAVAQFIFVMIRATGRRPPPAMYASAGGPPPPAGF